MRYVKKTISKEEYDKYSKMTKKELIDSLVLPIEWVCGYGYYGCDVMEQDGRFYVVHTIGNSCD